MGAWAVALVGAVRDSSERQLRSVEIVNTLATQAANIGEITRAVKLTGIGATAAAKVAIEAAGGALA